MVRALLATMLAALLFHVALEYLDKKATQAICVEHDSGTSCKHHDGALRPPTRCEACSQPRRRRAQPALAHGGARSRRVHLDRR